LPNIDEVKRMAYAAPKIRGWKTAIELELGRILCRRKTLLDQAMRYAVLRGGKRFRPLLSLAAGDAFGASPGTILPFACGIELIHNSSLIHDDLPSMDDDDFRRGRPSCHSAFGEDIALLAGDALLILAFEVMAAADVPRRLGGRKSQAILETARLAGVQGMIGGQLLDITFSAENAAEQSFEELMLKKTGALIVASIRSGALLGGASPAKLKTVTVFGEHIGLAFQIRDDVHDAADGGGKAASPGPNYALAIGMDRARERLAWHVRAGIEALDKAGIKSPELRSLASQLLKR
jgi:geranylgeranyl pyrophosphate synthase